MALVIVLGVLSVMLIMAMSFTIIMSTERTASANRISDMRLRHMLETALARAAANIEADLVDENTNRLVYPPWQVLASPSNWSDSFTNFGLFAEDFTNPVTATFAIDTFHPILGKQTAVYTNNGLLGVPDLPPKHQSKFKNEMTNYVPGALRAEAEIKNTNMYWQPVSFVNTIGVYTGKVQSMTVTTVVGRVCYLVLNCSGLWDANYVGGFSNAAGTERYIRQSGIDVREVDLTNFPAEIKNADQFLNQRLNDVRYDSVHDLVENNLRRFDDNVFPENLFVYSYARTGFWDSAANSVTGALFLGTAAEISAAAAKSQIISAFSNRCGLSPSQSGWAYTNLIAYLDPYPFVTEICVSNVVDYTASPLSYMLNPYITIECWWPFPSETGNKVGIVDVTVTFSGGSPDIRPASYPQGGPFQSHDVLINPATPFTNIYISLPQVPCETARPNYTSARVTYTIRSQRTGASVFSQTHSLDISPASWPDAADGVVTVSHEVVDPRFAGDPDKWRNDSTMSMYSNRAAHIYRTASSNAPYVDDWDRIGCSITNRLLTLGELGFIAYAPWQTINLTNSNHAKVFDVFRLDQKTNYHGLFNPNSLNRDALASAFANMPVDYYAGQPVAADKRLDLVKARLIADNIIANGPYTNISDLAKRAVWDPVFSAFSSLCTDKPTREALMRNSFGLFNVRQNVFEILLAAEAAGIDGRFALRPVRARAVAIVWRDPYTGRMFLRSIKHLRE